MIARQPRLWAPAWPSPDIGEWLRSTLSNWSARFASWKTEGDGDDLMGYAEPELVAALEFVASLLSERPSSGRAATMDGENPIQG